MSIQAFGIAGRYVQAPPDSFDAKLVPAAVLKQAMATAGGVPGVPRALGVEIFVPRAGGYWSALLGCRLEPGAGDALGIEVFCTSSGGHPARATSRINANAALQIEMPDSFARVVMAAAHRVASGLPGLGAGRLVFDVAATSEGSSEFVFDRLAQALSGHILATHGTNVTLGQRLADAFFP